MLDKYFNYRKHGTDFNTEVRAGTTTFLTMVYILALNPYILSLGGFDESTFLYGEELIFSEKCYQSNMIIVSHDKFIVEHSFGGSVRKYFRLRKYKHIYYGLFIYLTKYRNVNNLSSSLIAFLNATRQMFINIIKRNF